MNEPLLSLSLFEVKILKKMIDMDETPDQNRVMEKIVTFLNHPQCLKWEKDEDGTL